MIMLIHQEDITIISIYSLNNMAPKYIQQKPTEIKRELDNSIIIVGNINTSNMCRIIFNMCRTSRQRVTRKTEDVNNSINWLDLADSYKTLHLTRAEYAPLSSAHGTFSMINHILGYKTHLSEFKRQK